MTSTSFSITLYGKCCRLHVVGQQVVSDVSVVRSCLSICIACVLIESVTTPADCCTWNVYFASHNKHSLPHNMAACTP